MKYPAKLQKTLNDWWRQHGDDMHRPAWGVIKLSAGNTYEHNMRVAQICIYLLHNGIPFATEAILRYNVRPDIICPTHVCPIIEVLWSESKEDFVEKKAGKYPDTLNGKWILNNAADEFDPLMLE
jgi:hypothetical protein